MEVGLKEATAEREEEMRETKGQRLVYRNCGMRELWLKCAFAGASCAGRW